jgi:hypothetical protein
MMKSERMERNMLARLVPSPDYSNTSIFFELAVSKSLFVWLVADGWC